MKKTALLIGFLIIAQWGFCQQNDTINVVQDTIKTVTPTPLAAPAAVAAPAPVPAEAKTEASAPKKKDMRSLNEKFGFGLGASFWFSSTTTYVEVAPTLSYRFPKRLTTGIGYRYIYQHDKVYDADLNSYGPLLLAKVDLIPRIYFWTEYEHLKNKYISDIEDIPNFDSTTDSWFLGLGITQSVGKKGRGGIGIQVLYNVLYDEDEYSPYSGPFIYRIGFFF